MIFTPERALVFYAQLINEAPVVVLHCRRPALDASSNAAAKKQERVYLHKLLAGIHHYDLKKGVTVHA